MPKMIRATGSAWYLREDYLRILEIMEDADALPRMYDEWLEKAEGFERYGRVRGLFFVRAIIDPDEFLRWCEMKGLKADSSARNSFAVEFAERQDGCTH
jgi:hypothetical protein